MSALWPFSLAIISEMTFTPSVFCRPLYLQEEMFDPSDWRIPTSVTRVPATGHYVRHSYIAFWHSFANAKLTMDLLGYPKIVQEKPDELAHAISDVLNTLPTKSSHPPARL